MSYSGDHTPSGSFFDFDPVPGDLTSLMGPENTIGSPARDEFDDDLEPPQTTTPPSSPPAEEDLGDLESLHDKLDAIHDAIQKQHQEVIEKLNAAHNHDNGHQQGRSNGGFDLDQNLQDTIERKAEQDAEGIVQTIRGRYKEQKQELEALQQTVGARDEEISQNREEYEKLKAEFLKVRDHLEKERAANRRQFEKLQDYQGKIRVIARIRPMMKGEDPSNEQDFGERVPGEFSANWGQLRISEEQPSATGTRTILREQPLERIFGPEATNGDVFEELEFLISSGLSGSQCAIFAYGPSGTGKTHTLSAMNETGEPDAVNDGILPRTLAMVFDHAYENRHRWAFTFGLSATEIYMDEARDMISDPPAKVGLSRDFNQPSIEIQDYCETEPLLQRILAKRRVASTAVHDKSSRSHMIFSLRIHRESVDGSAKPVDGCVHICDLAGSEKIADTANPLQRKEGVDINSSLTDLITTLQQLGGGNRPTPSHSLGKVLRTCFEQSGRVVMLNLLSPLRSDYLRLTRPTLEVAQKVHKSRDLGRANGAAPRRPKALEVVANATATTSSSSGTRRPVTPGLSSPRTPSTPVTSGSASSSGPHGRPRGRPARPSGGESVPSRFRSSRV
ncbi:kinesin-like nuclear fusion protein [Neopestalotiopsis sp. 37M]|nr:kinesin-like nuclear fusion protein [Neopestalotiopsis sp. 37M]